MFIYHALDKYCIRTESQSGNENYIRVEIHTIRLAFIEFSIADFLHLSQEHRFLIYSKRLISKRTMFRVPALLNRVKCGATIASNVFLNQGPRFVRPVTTSAIRFGEEYVAKEEHDVEALFNAESSSRPDSQRRHGRPAAR